MVVPGRTCDGSGPEDRACAVAAHCRQTGCLAVVAAGSTARPAFAAETAWSQIWIGGRCRRDGGAEISTQQIPIDPAKTPVQYLWRYSLKIKTIENTSQYKMGWITSNLYPEKDHIGLKNQLILYWLKKITLSLWQHTQQSSYKAKIVEHRIFLLTCFSKVYESFRSLESE